MRIWQAIYNFFAETIKCKTNAKTPDQYEEDIKERKAHIADKLHSVKDTELVKLISWRRDNWREKYEEKDKELTEALVLLDNIYNEFPEVLWCKIIKNDIHNKW